ncbi:blue light receptor [Arachnomyces sp. PD_36]|nr:blue light receptor [Arachnomyces sp. PD_36]
MEDFYASQYPIMGSDQPTALATPEQNGPGTIPPDENDLYTSGGQTIDESVSHNMEQEPRLSMQQLAYIDSLGTEPGQASLMHYSGSDFGEAQFDHSQPSNTPVGGFNGAIDLSRVSTGQSWGSGNISSDTQYYTPPSTYENVDSSGPFISPLGQESSVGGGNQPPVYSPIMGMQIGFGGSRQAYPLPHPMKVPQNPDYITSPPQQIGNGSFAIFPTISQAQATPEIPHKQEKLLTSNILNGRFQTHLDYNRREVTSQNNSSSFMNSQSNNLSQQSYYSQHSSSIAADIYTVACAPSNNPGMDRLIPGNTREFADAGLEIKNGTPVHCGPLVDFKNGETEFLQQYSPSGLNSKDILDRVKTSRHLDGVDSSCAFVVCDLNAPDDPIVYVSDNFERLTGYSKREVLGRNCRFLQAPDGIIDAGANRNFVDGKDVFFLKSKIEARSETQTRLINYRKGGQSFLNLLTLVPIQLLGSDEYRFCVGFQVDLVEKPHAITKENPDGSYKVNYQRSQLPRYLLHTPETQQTSHHNPFPPSDKGITDGPTETSWERMLVERSNDLVHVLSLKGQFIYLSPSTLEILEYEENELLGTTISSICHPSDIVSLAREFREITEDSIVSLIYRIRRKDSGYIWFESYGSLRAIEPGEGGKCLMLTGRELPDYDLPRNNILEAGGMCEHELWTKISLSGMFLSVSSRAMDLLDKSPGELVGTSMREYLKKEVKSSRKSRPGTDTEAEDKLRHALGQARRGLRAGFDHGFQGKTKVLGAQTILYPVGGRRGRKPAFLIAQTRFPRFARTTPRSSRKNPSSPNGPSVPAEPTPPDIRPFKFAEHADIHESIFEERKPTRGTNWQAELSLLSSRNKKLQGEIEVLKNLQKRRIKNGPEGRKCAECDKTETPEWRKGPNGKGELCNSCGLQFAKWAHLTDTRFSLIPTPIIHATANHLQMSVSSYKNSTSSSPVKNPELETPSSASNKTPHTEPRENVQVLNGDAYLLPE